MYCSSSLRWLAILSLSALSPSSRESRRYPAVFQISVAAPPPFCHHVSVCLTPGAPESGPGAPPGDLCSRQIGGRSAKSFVDQEILSALSCGSLPNSPLHSNNICAFAWDRPPAQVLLLSRTESRSAGCVWIFLASEAIRRGRERWRPPHLNLRVLPRNWINKNRGRSHGSAPCQAYGVFTSPCS